MIMPTDDGDHGGGQRLQFAALDTGPTPLEVLRSDNEAALQRALAEIDEDDVTLVLPHRLTTLLTHVFPAGLAALAKVKECVEITDDLAKIHYHTVVYVVQPQMEDVRAVATHAGLLMSVQPVQRSFHLFVCGSWTTVAADILTHRQLDTVFRIHELDVGFVPIDSDLVTLGRERCLFDATVQGYMSSLVDLASALHQLERLYGSFDQIKCKGDLAARVAQQVVDKPPRAHTKSAGQTHSTHKSKRSLQMQSSLVLIDRCVDFASALCTPLTLEALIHEVFDSVDGFATVPMVRPHGPVEMMLALNASDAIYNRVRNLNYQAVSPLLNSEATSMKSAFDQFRASSVSASTAEVHEFVKGVPQMKAKQANLEKLVDLLDEIEKTTSDDCFRRRWRCERTIMDFDAVGDEDVVIDELEEMVFRHEPLLDVLRLMCLFSVTRDGFPRHQLARLKMRLVQAYGHELAPTFETLDYIGLLREATTPASLLDEVTVGLGIARQVSSFARVAGALNAIDPEVDPLNPGNMAFVTSGYAPVSCLLVAELLRRGTWEMIDSTISQISGIRSEIKRNTTKTTATTGKEDRGPLLAKSPSHRMVVCFVGGVTYIEIAAIRWISQFYPKYNVVIAATSVIGGRSFLNELLQRIPSTT